MATPNDLSDGCASWNATPVSSKRMGNDIDITNWIAGFTSSMSNKPIETFSQTRTEATDKLPPLSITCNFKNDVPSPFIPPNGNYKQGDLLLFPLNPEEIVQRLRKKVYQKVNIIMQELITDLESLGADKNQIINRLYQTSWFSALFDYDSISRLLNVFQVFNRLIKTYVSNSNALVISAEYKTLFDSIQNQADQPLEDMPEIPDLDQFLVELIARRDELVKQLYTTRLEIQEMEDKISQVKVNLEQHAKNILIKCDELETMHGKDNIQVNNFLEKYKDPNCSMPMEDQFKTLESLINSFAV